MMQEVAQAVASINYTSLKMVERKCIKIVKQGEVTNLQQEALTALHKFHDFLIV